MKRVLCMLLAMCWVVPAMAQEEGKPEEKKDGDNKAIEILKKLDAAAKKVQGVKYKAKFQGLEDAASRMAAVEGTVIMIGESQGTSLPKKYHFEGTIKAPNSSETKEFVTGSDGDNYFLIDHSTKTAYEDIDPMVVGRGGGTLSQALRMIEFVHPTPFSDEINGKKQEMKEDTKVEGVDCYQIHVSYAADGNQEAIWYVNKETFLPHRVDRIQTQGGQKQITSLVLSDIEVDPKVDDDKFKLKLPEGYTKSDDYAP
jgi:outer membrane lipoprotein-sorting protein